MTQQDDPIENVQKDKKDPHKIITTSIEKGEEGEITLQVEYSYDNSEKTQTRSLTLAPHGLLAASELTEGDDKADGKTGAIKADAAMIEKIRAAYTGFSKDKVLDVEEAGQIQDIIDKGMQKVPMKGIISTRDKS